MTSIAQNTEEITHPLFIEREVKIFYFFLITSNRGLCGLYNTQVIKSLGFISKFPKDGLWGRTPKDRLLGLIL